MNIGIFGATGSYDFGDYAMMIHNIQELHELDKEHTFTIFTISKEITYDNLKKNIKEKELLDRINIVDDNLINSIIESNSIIIKIYKKLYKIIHKKNMLDEYYDGIYQKVLNNSNSAVKEFINTLRKLDLCLFNGGGYLQHSWKYHNIRFMAEVRIAKSLNIPVVFLSNSVGPMSNYDIYTRETLPQVDYIMVRDGKRFSWSLLNDYGVDRKINGPDDLFNACDKYGMLNNDKEDYVIIEIMAWIDRAPSGKNFVINILAQFIDYLIKVERKKVKLINFDKSDVIAKNAIRDVLNIVEEPQKITAVYEIDNMYEVFDLYKNCCYSLSFKYHPVILAVGAGKPCAAIITDDDGYYKSKLEGAFMNCGMDEKKHVMHIDALTYEKIIKMYLETQYDVCDERIRKELLHTRSTYLESINNEELFC